MVPVFRIHHRAAPVKKIIAGGDKKLAKKLPAC
jgi:hypothetical protein